MYMLYIHTYTATHAHAHTQIRAKMLEVELHKTTSAKLSAETHAKTLLATINDHETVCLCIPVFCFV